MTAVLTDPLVHPRAQLPLEQPTRRHPADGPQTTPWGVQFARTPQTPATPTVLPAGLRLCPNRQITVQPDGQPWVTAGGTLRSDRTKENGGDRNIEREDEYTD